MVPLETYNEELTPNFDTIFDITNLHKVQLLVSLHYPVRTILYYILSKSLVLTTSDYELSRSVSF